MQLVICNYSFNIHQGGQLVICNYLFNIHYGVQLVICNYSFNTHQGVQLVICNYSFNTHQGGTQIIDYQLDNQWRDQLRISSSGAIRVVSSLDREDEHVSSKGVAIVKVIATDRGKPPLSSTGTLTITLTDINDCPPELIVTPEVLHVQEESGVTKIGTLRATDRDVWSLGHGPPFNFSLAKINKPHILQLLELKYFPSK